MDGYNIFDLDDMISELGEDRVKSMLLDFYCPHNKDVEDFIHRKAIEFSKQGLAKTQLVYTSFKKKPVLIGYFALSNKVIVSHMKALSKTKRGRLAKFCKFDKTTKTYTLPAILLAQFGKNYKDEYNKLITGDELLKIALDRVKLAQSIIGGKIVFLECDDVEYITQFYSKNGFFNFGERYLEKEEKDLFSSDYLIQMLKYI